MIKYDTKNEVAYIGLNSLFYFLEIYSLNIDLKNMRVFGSLNNEIIDIKFDKSEAFTSENSIYADLDSIQKKLNFKSINFDFSLLSLTLVPNFLLPYEQREKSKIERLRLDEKNQKVVDIDKETPSYLISPGFLKLNWDRYDFKNSEYNLDYEYGNQLLYGSFYINGELRPKNKINSGNLTYYDFWQGNDLILGSFSMITPPFINLSSDVIGVSIRDEDTYMTRDGGITIIKGEAENAQIIELYREFALIDYIYPQTKNFEFRILDGILNSDYTLKIYYNDGRIEERKVFSLSDMDILQKGRERVSLQIGKNSDDGKKQGISHVYYGVTDNITLGVGAMELNSFQNRKYRFLQNDILFNTNHKTYPTLVSFRNYYENTERESSYNIILEQKIKTYTLRYLQERYSPYVFEETNLKKYHSLSIGKNFEKNSFEMGVNSKSFFEKEEQYKSENIYFSWYTSLFSPLSFSLKMEKDLYRGYDYNVFYPSISYSGILSLIVDGEIGKEKAEKNYTQNYNIRLNKRDIKIKDRVYLDFGVFVRYSSVSEKFRYGIAFTMKLDNFIHLEVTSTTNISENKTRNTINSGRVTKLFNLKSPLANIDNTASVTSSWIYGKVYLDKNGNHIFDDGDIPLEKAEVLVENKGFFTNEKGEYLADGISNNSVLLVTVDRRSIDPSYKNSEGEIRIKTRSSSALRLDIPVQPISYLSGNIVLSEDFTEKQFMQNLAFITVTLVQNGEVIAQTDPEFDGMFIFEDVLPGKYSIKFNYLGYENVEFSTNNIDIEVKNSDDGEYLDGLDTEMIKEKKEEKI